MRGDYEFALQHLDALEQPGHSREAPLESLGEHLFAYYMYGLYPLNGTESLLQRFYERTDDTRQRWRDLFRHVGFVLRNTGKNLEESLKERITAFFEWRLEVGEAAEFGDFTSGWYLKDWMLSGAWMHIPGFWAYAKTTI